LGFEFDARVPLIISLPKSQQAGVKSNAIVELDNPALPSKLPEESKDDTGVSPVETIRVMIEELLQSAVVNASIRLSLVLGVEGSVVRIDTTAMPNGIVYSQVDEMA
jgi:hypothetical protein